MYIQSKLAGYSNYNIVIYNGVYISKSILNSLFLIKTSEKWSKYMTRELNLVNLDDKYIKYLYSKDKKVFYNKNQTRPYLGVLFECNGHKYYAPLSSPKPKHKLMKNNESFFKLSGGDLGIINFNNMIPVVDSAILPIDVQAIDNQKYKFLLMQQFEVINDKEDVIINKATKLYQKYCQGKLRELISRICCNFTLLEKESKNYNPKVD